MIINVLPNGATHGVLYISIYYTLGATYLYRGDVRPLIFYWNFLMII